MIEEKRNFPRYSQNGRVHIDILNATHQSTNSKIRYEGTMKDISNNGIRLHGKYRLEKNSVLELLVEFEADHSQFNLSGVIRWVTQTTENEFIAGLELDKQSADASQWQDKF